MVLVVVVNRQFAVLAGRIAMLEAGKSCSVLAGPPPADVVFIATAAACVD